MTIAPLHAISTRLARRSVAARWPSPWPKTNPLPSPEQKGRLMTNDASLAAEQQIRQLMDDWRRFTAAGNIDGLLSLLADDVVFLTPGNPPVTKADFAAGFAQVAAKAQVESTQEVKEIRVSGDIAYAWSYLSVVLTPKDGSGSWTSAGHV